MSDSKTLRPIIEHTPFETQPTQNVHGWERIGSVAGGVMMVGKGLRRGGLFGLIQVAIGGVALAQQRQFRIGAATQSGDIFRDIGAAFGVIGLFAPEMVATVARHHELGDFAREGRGAGGDV